MIVALYLALVMLGAMATFASGFAFGMDVADTFAVGGEAHTVWTGVLYATSGAAFLAIPAVVVGRLALSRRISARAI